MKRISTRESYKTYPEKIAKETFDLIRIEANKLRIEKIKEGYEVTLPGRLGTMFITKFKPEKASIDFGLFRKTGIKAPHLNLSTKGFVPRFIWNKRKAYIKYKILWAFRLNRNVKRSKEGSLSNHFKKHGLDNYQETTHFNSWN